MRLRWLRQALRDLDEEARFIASEDERAATLVVQRIFEAVAKLAAEPGIGRPGRLAGTRELVVHKTNYVVPYRVRGDEVQVLRVFYTSRRLPQRW